ncbi:MAG: sulfite exporter TauE/SafE family protein [Ruminococcaceae bacterium]|nr:sulfite exporter TauE/SafE family protein [Oscillospiraceae bacterium]
MTTMQMILIVCPLVFLASFVDSIAGGGGLISLPAFMLTGMPVHMACGSNKFSACAGSIISAVRFYKNGKMHVLGAVISGILALAGAAIGSKLNLMIDSSTLKKIFLIILPVVAVFVLFGGNSRRRKTLLEGKKLYLSCALIGFFIGAYDGLIGPGTGTFMIFCYTTFVGFDYVTASGNAKVANLSSNFASMVLYLFAGQILFSVAVPAAICCICGGWLGSGMAIQKGSKFIKAMLIVVLIGIFGKLIWDLHLFG